MSKQIELTARQAAERLGIGLHRLYELLWEGKLGARRVDGRWRIPVAAVEARLEARETQR